MTFCVSNTITKTIVHFLPAAHNVTAPYPVQCRLTLFGENLRPEPAVLEGARLRQPDGVRLEDVFPALRQEGGGLFGLQIEIAGLQSRIDVAASSCVIELVSAGLSTRFRPLEMSEGEPRAASGPHLLGLADRHSLSSMVIVNGSGADFEPQLFSTGVNGAAEAAEVALPEKRLPPGAVREFTVCQEGAPSLQTERMECSWGPLAVRNLFFRRRPPREIGCFAVYRDNLSKRPVSVCAL